MRGPEDGLITFLLRALRRLFESRGSAALGDDHAGDIGRRRHLERHRRGLARRDAGLALRAHTGILHRDSVNGRCDIAWQIRQAYPINPVTGAAVVNDRFPLNEPRRWRFYRGARFRVWAEPARPLAARILRVSRAHKKLHPRLTRQG